MQGFFSSTLIQVTTPCRVTQEELHHSQSRQSEAFREEREGLVERVRFLEEQLAASQASAAAAAEQMPVGDACP